jgi:hypothetical protein
VNPLHANFALVEKVTHPSENEGGEVLSGRNEGRDGEIPVMRSVLELENPILLVNSFDLILAGHVANAVGIENLSIAYVDESTVVEEVVNLGLHNLLEVAEVDDHTLGGVVRIVNERTFNLNEKTIAMTVRITALRLVVRDTVAHIPLNFLGNSELSHVLLLVGEL